MLWAAPGCSLFLSSDPGSLCSSRAVWFHVRRKVPPAWYLSNSSPNPSCWTQQEVSGINSNWLDEICKENTGEHRRTHANNAHQFYSPRNGREGVGRWGQGGTGMVGGVEAGERRREEVGEGYGRAWELKQGAGRGRAVKHRRRWAGVGKGCGGRDTSRERTWGVQEWREISTLLYIQACCLRWIAGKHQSIYITDTCMRARALTHARTCRHTHTQTHTHTHPHMQTWRISIWPIWL